MDPSPHQSGSRYGQQVTNDRIRVAVLYGGRSSEHSISCISAGGILRALDPRRYDAIPIGITQAGEWFATGAEPSDLEVKDGVLPSVTAVGRAITLGPDPQGSTEFAGGVDVVFPVLHGPWGEDGTVQGLLEMAGLPYVGSGVLASAAAMDKAAMKALFRAAGLEVEHYAVITDRQWRQEREASLERAAAVGFPLFVKPARAGSSLGISKVRSVEDLPQAIELARSHDPKVIVETSVEGAREIECGVLVQPTGESMASRCAEIVVGGDHEFYDFAAKYLDDSAELIVPADLDHAVEGQVRSRAIEAFEALGCEGLARVDFFIARDGRILVNEVNTMPGFTPISMFPRMWQASGVEYPALVEHLVQDALIRGSGLR